MSLEQQLAGLSEKVANLDETIGALITVLQSGEFSKKVAGEILDAPVTPPKQQKSAPSSGTTKKESASTAPSDSGASTEVDWDVDLAVPFTKLYSSNKEAAKQVLADFGVAKLGEVPKDKWPELKAALENA